ncbi:POTRA domain-containing protein [Seonamhaeicola algicola]|uniref:POTRA domain-containing protein n=1 Tax=Seonamhaeicola algicola TaxID=1719036 RepID=UPI001FE9B7A3|nr:POTRA domain-containing protein [Seonamhaeicola algicola]
MKIYGASEVETLSIDSLNYQKKHKDLVSLENEINTSLQTLYKKGYLESYAENIKKINDSSFICKINLNNLYEYLEVFYNTKKDLLKDILRDKHPNPFTLKFSKTESTLNELNENIGNKGFPFIKLKLDNFKIKDKKTVTAYLVIDDTSKKRTINNIVVKGYEKFPKSFLKYYLKIKPKQTFNLNKIKKQIRALQSLSFASEIKTPEVLFTKDSTTLYLYINKKQSNAFDGFLGFGSNEDTNKIEFDGYLNLNLVNNLNFGESFKLLYKSDENDQKTFNANLSLPYIFKSPVGLDLGLNIFKKDSTFTTAIQCAKLHYQINPEQKFYSGIINETSSNLLNNTQTAFFDYKKNYFTIGYQYSKPQNNDILFPVNTLFYIESNFGERKQKNNTTKQSSQAINTFKIFNLNKKNSLYFKLSGAVINSRSFFENELLRFGGINSIRGFEENSLYATLFGVMNTEYRLKLNSNIYIHSVIDAGYYENEIINVNEKLFGYGFGFGIFTKSGLFKLNYANGKSEGQQFKFSNSKVHISLTTIF